MSQEVKPPFDDADGTGDTRVAGAGDREAGQEPLSSAASLSSETKQDVVGVADAAKKNMPPRNKKGKTSINNKNNNESLKGKQGLKWTEQSVVKKKHHDAGVVVVSSAGGDADPLGSSIEEGDSSSIAKGRYGAKDSARKNSSYEPTFPVKLHMILSHPEYQDIIAWLPHGRSWRILQQKAFEEKVIPIFFRHVRYSSFARQVNGWGFQRVTQGSDYNSYYHELFLRGMPHLCKKMKRLTQTDILERKNRPVDDEAACPNFYAMSREHPLPESASAQKDTKDAGSKQQEQAADVEYADGDDSNISGEKERGRDASKHDLHQEETHRQQRRAMVVGPTIPRWGISTAAQLMLFGNSGSAASTMMQRREPSAPERSTSSSSSSFGTTAPKSSAAEHHAAAKREGGSSSSPASAAYPAPSPSSSFIVASQQQRLHGLSGERFGHARAGPRGGGISLGGSSFLPGEAAVPGRGQAGVSVPSLGLFGGQQQRTAGAIEAVRLELALLEQRRQEIITHLERLDRGGGSSTTSAAATTGYYPYYYAGGSTPLPNLQLRRRQAGQEGGQKHLGDVLQQQWQHGDLFLPRSSAIAGAAAAAGGEADEEEDEIKQHQKLPASQHRATVVGPLLVDHTAAAYLHHAQHPKSLVLDGHHDSTRKDAVPAPTTKAKLLHSAGGRLSNSRGVGGGPAPRKQQFVSKNNKKRNRSGSVSSSSSSIETDEGKTSGKKETTTHPRQQKKKNKQERNRQEDSPQDEQQYYQEAKTTNRNASGSEPATTTSPQSDDVDALLALRGSSSLQHR